MGKGPLVSFLIPTRGRPEQLRDCVEYLIETSKNSDNCEFILRADFDDKVTLSMLSEEDSIFPKWEGRGVRIKLLFGPRGRGWRDIYLWLNDMALVSSGDWLSIWNDDAFMITEGWDSIIEEAEVPIDNPRMADICFIQFMNDRATESFSYGVWRRKGFDLLGRFSPFSLADHWLHEVLGPNGAFILPERNEIHLNHPRYVDRDATFTQGSRSFQLEVLEELKTPKALEALESDILKIREYLHMDN